MQQKIISLEKDVQVLEQDSIQRQTRQALMEGRIEELEVQIQKVIMAISRLSSPLMTSQELPINGPRGEADHCTTAVPMSEDTHMQQKVAYGRTAGVQCLAETSYTELIDNLGLCYGSSTQQVGSGDHMYPIMEHGQQLPCHEHTNQDVGLHYRP